MQGNTPVNPLLAQLDEVIVPAQVSPWPPAPLWWLIGAVVLALIGFGAWRYYQRHQFLAAKREAISLSQQLNSEQCPQLHQLLKRLTQHYYGERLAALPTTQWQGVIEQLSGVAISHAQLTSLYQETNGSNELAAKLKQAIEHFKTNEAIHV